MAEEYYKGKAKKHQSGFCPEARKVVAANGDTILNFDSIAEASRKLNMKYQTIHAVLSGRRNSAFNWRFTYGWN